jgi:hypothetical protein
MRRFLRLLLLLAALAVATSAGAQDELKLNQTYRDAIQLKNPFPYTCGGEVSHETSCT